MMLIVRGPDGGPMSVDISHLPDGADDEELDLLVGQLIRAAYDDASEERNKIKQ